MKITINPEQVDSVATLLMAELRHLRGIEVPPVTFEKDGLDANLRVSFGHDTAIPKVFEISGGGTIEEI